MRALVVYESMYGNTHLVADAIGEGLATAYQVEVVPVAQASTELLGEAELVVVGGPTHAHGLSRANTRQAAASEAHKPGSELTLDPDAEGPGLRDWFHALPVSVDAKGAAFDTRIDAPAVLTGRASKGITRQLRQHGFEVVAEARSFLVTKQNVLEPEETTRARQWGRDLAETLATSV